MTMTVGGVNRPRRIVTGLHEDGTSYLARVEEVDEVVWLHEVAHAISGAVARARTRGLFHAIHHTI